MFYLVKPNGQSLFTPEIISKGTGRYLHEIEHCALTNEIRGFPTWNLAHAYLITNFDAERLILLENMDVDRKNIYDMRNPDAKDNHNDHGSILWRRNSDDYIIDAIQWTDINTSDIFELFIKNDKVIKVSMKNLGKMKVKFTNEYAANKVSSYEVSQGDYISVNDKNELTIHKQVPFEIDFDVV